MSKKLLLLIALTLLLGVSVFSVWKQSTVVAPTTPEPVVTPEPTPEPVSPIEYLQHIEAIPGNTDEVWYNIPEYGVRMKLNKEFGADLQYKFIHEKNINGEEWDTIYLFLKNLDQVAPGCGGHGVLGQYQGNVKEMERNKDQLNEFVSSRLDDYFQAGDFYYSWTGGQEVCWDPSLEEEVRKVFPGKYTGVGAKNIRDGIKTIQLIPQK